MQERERERGIAGGQGSHERTGCGGLHNGCLARDGVWREAEGGARPDPDPRRRSERALRPAWTRWSERGAWPVSGLGSVCSLGLWMGPQCAKEEPYIKP